MAALTIPVRGWSWTSSSPLRCGMPGVRGGSALAGRVSFPWAAGPLGEIWRASRGQLVCPDCRRQTAATRRPTVFHPHELAPASSGFIAAWELTSQKYGANALGLQSELGLGSYKTAWGWLHMLRRAMVKIEISDTDERRSRKWTTAPSGASRLECGAARRSRRPASRSPPRSTDARSGDIPPKNWVPDLSAPVLRGFVQDRPLSPCNHPAHRRMAKLSGTRQAWAFATRSTNLSTSGDLAHVLMSTVHQVASLIQALGPREPHQGLIAREHLPLPLWIDVNHYASIDAHPGLRRSLLFIPLA